MRLLLLHDTEHDLPAIESVLSAHGHYVRSMAVNALTLQDEIDSWNPELILIAADNAARDVLEQVCVVSQFGERPIVMFTEDHDPVARRAAIQARFSAYVVAGLSAKRVGAVIDVALERFQHDQRLFADLQAAQQQVNVRNDRDQVVAQAKALLRRRGMSEPDAYSQLRKQAMQDRCSVAEAAARVLSGA